LLRYQRHSFLHQQPAQNQPPELVCQLGQEPYLEVLHRQLDRPLLYLVLHRQLVVLNHQGKSSPARTEVHRPLLYPFLLLLHLCPEELRHHFDRPLLHQFLLLLHLCPQELRHRLVHRLLHQFLLLLHLCPQELRHQLVLLRR
jgi:hypothetical protein